MPPDLDGLDVELVLAGHPIKICYRVSHDGCGPRSVELNGVVLGFVREENPYRCGGVRIPLDQFKSGAGRCG
uniref:CAZy families GH94 protein n=1 Tax=uncultured Methylococcus sp. TaxID=236501 RepID=A0A060CFL3_9GAMM|nr:CAZy families GH94 protein [uncultured Methylococcus sp.]